MNINPDQAVDNLEIQVNNEGITQYKDEYSGNTYSVKDGKITITIPKASEGGTVVLVPSGFNDTLVAPQISTIAKGKTTLLPSQLTHIAEDGTKSPVEVTYIVSIIQQMVYRWMIQRQNSLCQRRLKERKSN